MFSVSFDCGIKSRLSGEINSLIRQVEGMPFEERSYTRTVPDCPNRKEIMNR